MHTQRTKYVQYLDTNEKSQVGQFQAVGTLLTDASTFAPLSSFGSEVRNTK